MWQKTNQGTPMIVVIEGWKYVMQMQKLDKISVYLVMNEVIQIFFLFGITKPGKETAFISTL